MTSEDEYLEFVKQFKYKDDWPTNLEFFQAACKWQRNKIKSNLSLYDDTEDSDCVLSFYRYKELFDEHAA